MCAANKNIQENLIIHINLDQNLARIETSHVEIKYIFVKTKK